MRMKYDNGFVLICAAYLVKKPKALYLYLFDPAQLVSVDLYEKRTVIYGDISQNF